MKTFEDLSQSEQDIIEALTNFANHSEQDANEIIGYIENLKELERERYKQKVRDAIIKSRSFMLSGIGGQNHFIDEEKLKKELDL